MVPAHTNSVSCRLLSSSNQSIGLEDQDAPSLLTSAQWHTHTPECATNQTLCRIHALPLAGSSRLSCWPTEWEGGESLSELIQLSCCLRILASRFLFFSLIWQDRCGLTVVNLNTHSTYVTDHYSGGSFTSLQCFSRLQALPSTLERRRHKAVQPEQAPAQQGFHTDLVPKHL